MIGWVAERRGLYAIVDPEQCRGHSPVDVAAAILKGGCAVLQLRAKTLTDRDFLWLAEILRGLCRGVSVPFVVNDRPDIARLVQADGVHLGQDDLPPADVRDMIGGSMAMGVSTHNLEQARGAVAAGADLIGFGPVFPTQTKENPDPVVGLQGLRQVASDVSVPVVAIGGITEDTAGQCAAAGVRYWAAISALCASDDIEGAARRLHRQAGVS